MEPKFKVDDVVLIDGARHRVLHYDKRDEDYCVSRIDISEGSTSDTFWVHADSLREVPKTVAFYVNVDEDGFRGSYNTREHADSLANPDRIARVRVQYTEGQFDD